MAPASAWGAIVLVTHCGPCLYTNLLGRKAGLGSLLCSGGTSAVLLGHTAMRHLNCRAVQGPQHCGQYGSAAANAVAQALRGQRMPWRPDHDSSGRDPCGVPRPGLAAKRRREHAGQEGEPLSGSSRQPDEAGGQHEPKMRRMAPLVGRAEEAAGSGPRQSAPDQAGRPGLSEGAPQERVRDEWDTDSEEDGLPQNSAEEEDEECPLLSPGEPAHPRSSPQLGLPCSCKQHEEASGTCRHISGMHQRAGCHEHCTCTAPRADSKNQWGCPCMPNAGMAGDAAAEEWWEHYIAVKLDLVQTVLQDSVLPDQAPGLPASDQHGPTPLGTTAGGEREPTWHLTKPASADPAGVTLPKGLHETCLQPGFCGCQRK